MNAGPVTSFVQILVEGGYVFDVSVDEWAKLRRAIEARIEWLGTTDIYGADCTIRLRSITGARGMSPDIEDAFRAAHPDDDEGWR